MSETGGTRPDVSKLHWADGVGAYTKTEALEAKKDVGYDTDEIPPSEEWNWWRNFLGQLFAWLDGAHTREFSALNEAIDAVDTPDIFRIGQPAAGNYLPKVDVWSAFTPAAITGSILDVKTDGYRIYIIDNNRNLVAINPETGATLWNVTLAATFYPNQFAASGDYLYLSGLGGNLGLVEVDASDGSEVQRVGNLNSSANGIVANGQYAVAVDQTAGNVRFYSGLGGTLVEDGTVALGGNYQATALAIDRNQVYVLALDTVAFTSQVRAYSLATRGLLWTFNNPVGVANKQSKDIACDGEFIYTANILGTHSVSGNQFNAIVIDRQGNEILHTRIGGFSDMDHVRTDGRICFYTENATGYTRACSCRGLSLGYLWSQGDMVTTDCDGVSSTGFDSSNQVIRRRSADQPVTYQRVDADDPNRRPLYNLAIPKHNR